MANPIVKLARQQILRLLDGQRVQVPTSVGLLEVEAKADDHWQPMRKMPDVPDHIRAVHEAIDSTAPTEIWRNDIYEVMVFTGEDQITHLSIKRLDRAAVRNWRHLQQMKNEIVGPLEEAVELFPSEARIADNANQLHLWVIPGGIPIGFKGGMVTIADEDVQRYNESGTRGRQEPMQPGLTVGEGMQAHQEAEGIDTMGALDQVTAAAREAMGGRR